jgi:hypothetical protein
MPLAPTNGDHAAANRSPLTEDLHMSTPQSSPTGSRATYRNVVTQAVSVNGVDFVYRQLGPDDGVPLA